MFKLTFALLLLVPGCLAQCTSHSCGDTDSLQTQMKVIMQRLDQLASENIELKATIEGHKTNIREQQAVNQELRTTTRRLETTDAELRTTIEQLRSANEELRLTNEELQTAVDSHQMNISHIQMTSTDLQTTNDQLRETVNSLQRNVTQMQTTSTASAAYFSVATARTESYTSGYAIKFPVTFANVVPAGSTGGWNAATNTYTCPVDGDYMFVVTLWKGNGDDFDTFDAHLTRTSLSGADTRIVYLYNHKHSSISDSIWFSSTMQAIVPCAEGEKVWVRAYCNACRLWEDGARFNTFTGFKL